MCASVWAGVRSPFLGQGGGEKEERKEEERKEVGEGETEWERREEARVPLFPTPGQFSFVAGLTTGSLSICLNANIRNILFGCS